MTQAQKLEKPKTYRYAVFDGRNIIGIRPTMDDALVTAHNYEMEELVLKNRLCICDIMPIVYRLH